MRITPFLTVLSVCLVSEAVASSEIAGIGTLGCTEIVDLNTNSTEAVAVTNWSYGYWTGFNVFLARDCRLKKDLKGLADNPEAAFKLVQANCLLRPTNTIMVSAFVVLDSQPNISGSMAAVCSLDEQGKSISGETAGN